MTENAPPEDVTPASDNAGERPSADEWQESGKGKVRVRTDFLRAYNSADSSLPSITSEGLYVSREQADMLFNESGGLVYEDTDYKED